MVYGFKKSKIDGTELEFKEKNGMRVPSKYSYVNYLPSVVNQGSKPICVPCSVSSFINYKLNVEKGNNKTDNKVDYGAIYASRTTDGDEGMTFKDAFKYLKEHGVKTEKGNVKVARYARIGGELQLKQAILLNGPCFGALPVYDSMRYDFWVKESGDSLQGGHAIAIVGYNDEGFIIRNSWGKGYGKDGYSIMPYEDFNTFIEVWTVFE